MDRVKSRLSKKENWIVFAVFSILLIVVSTFHEPWFDEAQAWQIARCASFKEILFTIPHYEGHPPLWHLLLSVPAKLGMPYELSLKGISCLIAMAVTMLIVFKAPFPKYIRFLVPFGYFCFYQFGVVARPYQLLTLAILLTAIYYKTKDVHSIRFVLCLAFLCMTSAYGIILAGGIAFAWLFDILLSKPWSSFKNIVCDSRVWSLFVLLIFAVFLGLNLLPEKNTYALRGIENRFSWEYLLTCYFAYFTDSFLTTIRMSYESSAIVSAGNGIVSVVLSILAFLGILCFSTKKSAKYFFIPYLLFCPFCVFVYVSIHHTGIFWSLLLFWAWITLDNQVEVGDAFVLLKKLPRDLFQTIKRVAKVFVVISLVLSIVWTGFASYYDIVYPYSFGRDVSGFIKEHRLDQCRIACPWVYGDSGYMDVNEVTGAINVLPYFDDNCIYTLNYGASNRGYLSHILYTEEETEKALENMRCQGLPEVIIGTPYGEFVVAFGSSFDLRNYVPVFRYDSERPAIWKWYFAGEDVVNYNYVYVKKDMIEEYGLTVITPDPYYYPYPIS